MQHPLFIAKAEASARRRRHDLLLRLLVMLPSKPAILDVGGTVDYWRALDFPIDAAQRIVLLNTYDQRACEPFASVVGDARDLSRFEDGEFDIAFSNSVIGHVGGFADQQRMAREILRVGKHFFVQTPNHGFPIDWRTLMPFFHFLPVETQAWCFEHSRVGAYRKAENSEEAMNWATRIRNIRRGELELLFPNARVINERILGFTKSFIVHNLPYPHL